MNDSKKDKKKDKKKPPSAHSKRDEIQSSAKMDDFYLDIKKNRWNYSIIFILTAFVFLSFYMQYVFEVNQRKFHSGESDEINHYEVLGLEQGATMAEIRKSYRELAKVWHPDKNPNCEACTDKFKQIAKSYEYLTDQSNRENDKMGKSIFASSPIYLTTKNYHRLVEQSNDFWVILVYEGQSGNNYNKYVAEVFDEVSTKFHNIVKFGVIDVLYNDNLLHFLPYKFQYFPNILTFLEGSSDLLENFDLFSVTTLTEFIEHSYINKVELVSDSSMKSLLPSAEESFKPLSGRFNLLKDIQIDVFCLSTKNYIDIVTKDFARAYEQNVKVYQNDLGYYGSTLKIFQSKGNYRVFVSYSDYSYDSKQGEYLYKKSLSPIPIYFSISSNLVEKLQKAFIFSKSLLIQRLYKNNYHRHCVNKLILDSEESESLQKSEATRINLCIVILERSEDKSSNDFDKEFAMQVTKKFNEKVKNALDGSRKKSDEYFISINYGLANLDSNPALKQLYEKFLEAKNLKDSNEEKLLLVINDTNEKFVFKAFKSPRALGEHISDLDNSDYYEDISLAFDYFANYGIIHPADIFSEQSNFSLSRMLNSLINSQMQPSYILTYIVLAVVNVMFLKFDFLKFFAVLFGISITSGLVINIIFH